MDYTEVHTVLTRWEGKRLAESFIVRYPGKRIDTPLERVLASPAEQQHIREPRANSRL